MSSLAKIASSQPSGFAKRLRREKINRPWLDKIVDYCGRFSIPQGVLMEIGAGFGTFAALAAALGQFKKVLAVEPTPEMAPAPVAKGA
ncbi:MAG: hypothetical protein HZA50_05415 [Planctomycetes bacterium]|nr:hypothetical protein [Planctomycetota bacterium]